MGIVNKRYHYWYNTDTNKVVTVSILLVINLQRSFQGTTRESEASPYKHNFKH